MPTLNDVLIMLPEFYVVTATCFLFMLDAFMKPDQTVTAFGGMFIRDTVAEIIKVFALATTAMVFVYGRPYLIDRGLRGGEFYTLMLFAVVGIMLVVSAGNLVT